MRRGAKGGGIAVIVVAEQGRGVRLDVRLEIRLEVRLAIKLTTRDKA